jgi:hypothetical protein
MKLDPISKITNTKRADRVTQVVGHMGSKCEVLTSNPNTAKTKQNKKHSQ